MAGSSIAATQTGSLGAGKLLSRSGDRSGFIGELMQLYTNLPATATAEKERVGFLLLSSRAVSEASRIFQDLVRQSPQNAAARRGQGKVYLNSGQYLSARHEFQRALRLDPKDSESEKMLALSNDVIDMDPVLPYITSAEQIRRSRNLLNRVVKDLDACGANSDVWKQRLDNAGQLLASDRADDDAASAMQRAAAQLWDDKVTACGKAAPEDRALDTVLTRIGHE